MFIQFDLDGYVPGLAIPILLVTIVILLTQIFVYIENTSISYEVIPGKIHKINENFYDSLQGKVIMRKGALLERERVIGAQEFDRVAVIQSAIDKLFNVGTLKIVEADRLNTTRSIKLPYITAPHAIAKRIQSMIDIQTSMTQTM